MPALLTVGVATRRALLDAIEAALPAASADEAVQVVFAWAPGLARFRRLIFTHQLRADHEPAGLRAGRKSRNEDGSFDVVCLVTIPGGTPEQAAEAAVGLAGVVESVCADQADSLPVEGLQWVVVSRVEVAEAASDSAAVAEAAVSIQFRARLT